MNQGAFILISVVAAVNDECIFEKNLKASNILSNPDVKLFKQLGFSSASLAYNEGLKNSSCEIVIFAHQDVYFPTGWMDQLASNISFLNQSDPEWAVIGVYGVKPSGEHVGQAWSSGLNKLLGKPFNQPELVDSIDELVIILNVNSGLSFDDKLPGFHLYATDIVQSANEVGKKAYVINAPVIHNSNSVLFLDANYYKAYSYLKHKWNKRLPIQNCILTIGGDNIIFWKRRVKDYLKSIYYLGRKKGQTLDDRLCAQQKARELGFE